ncbi:MAG: SHOCT domain-containing protein [Bacteroidia bacterium]
MFYNGYHFFGMHLIWWVFWLLLLFWTFASPYNIPGHQKTKNSALDILQKRFAAGQITKEQYLEHKALLEKT